MSVLTMAGTYRTEQNDRNDLFHVFSFFPLSYPTLMKCFLFHLGFFFLIILARLKSYPALLLRAGFHIGFSLMAFFY